MCRILCDVIGDGATLIFCHILDLNILHLKSAESAYLSDFSAQQSLVHRSITAVSYH